MAKFMVLYRSSVSARDQMANATPEQVQAGMDAWMAWAGKARDASVDLGAPLAAATRRGSGSSAVGGDDISGYSILQSDSVEALVNLVEEHPHHHVPGNSIEVLEILAMPGT